MPAEDRGGGGGVFKILEEMAKSANKSEDKQMWSINDEAVARLDVFALTSHEKAAERSFSPPPFAVSAFSAIGHCRLI